MRSEKIKMLLVMLACGLAMALVGPTVYAATETTIQAQLSGPTLNNMVPHGLAENRVRIDGSRRLKVQVEDVNLPAGTVLNVFLNGTSIGSISINSLRQGELQIETNNGQTVPVVTPGALVEVKTQAGTLVVSGAFSNAAPSPTPTTSPSPGATPSPSPTPDDDSSTTIQFESPSYSVNEDAMTLAVIVTRTGDLSHDSKVDYRSVDGSAQQRTDFTTAAGRLFFAPGERSKTITLLITNDGFAEGDEIFSLVLFDASHSTSLGNPAITTITITDNDAGSTVPNPVDDPKSFIVQHYMDFLNRQPDDDGLRAWEDVLKNCEAGDDRCDRVQVSSSFFRSAEFQDRGYFLYRFYSTSLSRIPHYDEFEKDMSRTSGFFTLEQQEANKALFADDFVTRQEFKDRFDQYVGADDFVTALLNVAGVTVSNKDNLVAALQNGQMSRAQVLRAISDSPELKSKVANEAFVVMQYFGYLRRDPDPHYHDWIRVMDDTGDYRTMINGFIGSIEYRHRFGDR